MTKFVRIGTYSEAGLQELGEATLRYTFSVAKYAFLPSTRPIDQVGYVSQEAVQENLAFVQGSGVETLIRFFGLNLDATSLRSTFFWHLAHTSQ